MRISGLAAAALLFAAALTASCNNGDYDAYPDVDLSGTTNPLDTNNNNGGGGGNNNSFNWSGTDPMSATIDGNAWLAVSANYIGLTTYAILGSGSSYGVNVVFPSAPVPGMEFECGSNNPNAGFSLVDGNQTSPTNGYSTGLGGSGRVRVEDTTGGKIKGRFYGVVKNQAGTARTITNGYFNVPE